MEFWHVPVMLNECIESLNILPYGTYIDGTLGGGGHSSAILSKLTTGKLIAFDKDEVAINHCKKTLAMHKDKITFINDDFKNFKQHLNNLGINKVDGILLDLGVSSYQIDNPERGFSYMHDAPLDMRMNQEQKKDAWEVVNEYSEEKLVNIFSQYGQEPFSKRIAHAIIAYRRGRPIDTTSQLVEIIQRAVPNKSPKQGHPAKRVFQAIRIEVNAELEKLNETLLSMARSLNHGGRLCVLTFHSLEDKITKDAFGLLCTDCICDKRIPVCVCHHKKEGMLVFKKPQTATAHELSNNPRSHSAKLRVFQKL
ncbi:MAG: 16S rRNA (cytosine(1402)-N(4))-methyltransferase RsmH [Clostridia bacterium]|nr:16S rRNA (cytosine(1402)-N(4))-methyltransferase RsmH [Clostridia bacterium]